MNCREARDALTAKRGTAAVEDHVGACAACRRYALRLEAVREELRRHHAGTTPDAAFAARVRANLPVRRPVEALGWAAVRLLPVSLVLALALGWLAWERAASPVEPVLGDSAASDPLVWLLESEGEGT